MTSCRSSISRPCSPGGGLVSARRDGGLVLVCGNGRRDRCCARFGPPTWRLLAAAIGEEAWLSTHQGGHRYAGTGICLPEGVAYGFLAPAEAEPLLAARRDGAIHLPCFRGRTFHDAPVQAADALLRASRGEAALDRLAARSISGRVAGRVAGRLLPHRRAGTRCASSAAPRRPW